MAPVALSTANTYRYWLLSGSGSISYEFIYGSWSYTDTATNDDVFSAWGDENDSDAANDSGSATAVVGPYIDISFIPELGGEITEATLAAIASSAQVPFILRDEMGQAVAMISGMGEDARVAL